MPAETASAPPSSLSAVRRDIGVLGEEPAGEVQFLEVMLGTVQEPRHAVKAFTHRNSASAAPSKARSVLERGGSLSLS
jgi:hypothetical protein